MKLGYKILIAIGIIISIYTLISYNSKQKERITKEVNRLITNIRREDYFSIQNALAPNLAQTISIDDIKEFIKDINLTRDSKFVLKEYTKDRDLIKVKGNILTKNKELPFNIVYKESNSTLLIITQQLGSKVLKPKKNLFPIKNR